MGESADAVMTGKREMLHPVQVARSWSALHWGTLWVYLSHCRDADNLGREVEVAPRHVISRDGRVCNARHEYEGDVRI